MPLQRLDTRRAEFRADQGAVLAGHLVAMRSVLLARKSFEVGRSGWEEAVCATHPPVELRLERLEVPGLEYPLFGDEPSIPAGWTGETTQPVDRAGVLPPPATAGSMKGWMIFAAAAIAVCALFSVLTVTQTVFFKPASAVEGYFDALADRDGEEALSWLDTSIRAELGDSPLLVELIAAQAYRPPTDMKILRVDSDDENATVEVEYTLGDAAMPATLHLVKTEDKTLGIFRGWRVLGGVSSISGDIGAGLKVNGVDIPAQEGDDAQSQVLTLAFPGSYEVSTQANALTDAQTVTVHVDLGGRGAVVNLQPVLSPKAEQEATRLVEQFLGNCAKQTVPDPPGCPLDFPSYLEPETVKWEIVKYPVVEVVLVDYASARVSTPSGTRGTARVSWTETSLGVSSDESRTVSISISGVVIADGDRLTFGPQP
jgi:hypothetical protein